MIIQMSVEKQLKTEKNVKSKKLLDKVNFKLIKLIDPMYYLL